MTTETEIVATYRQTVQQLYAFVFHRAGGQREIAEEQSLSERAVEGRLLGARTRLEEAEIIVSAVAKNHEEMVAMQADGTVSAIQLKEVEFQLSQARAEERLARMELEYLEKTLSQ